MAARKKKKVSRKRINCVECKSQTDCCSFGTWIDLEEAKRIISAGIKGDFFHLEIDRDFPSGYRVGTSYEDNLCSFLDPDGLCSIHKVDYSLKPKTCKEFPYENDKLSEFADMLCTLHKSRMKPARTKTAPRR